MNSEKNITNSNLLNDELRELLNEESILVSGQPLIFYGASGETNYYDDCEYVIDTQLFVTTAIIKNISDVNRHLPEKYIGEYPIIFGTTEPDRNGDEYVFGVRPELGFEARPVNQAPLASTLDS